MERRKRLSEVAAELGIGVKTLREAIRRGDLKAIQPGRTESAWYYVTDSDVQSWLEQCGRRSG